MFAGLLMVQVNLHTVVSNHSKDNKFVTGVKIKAKGDSKLNESPHLQAVLLIHGHLTRNHDLLIQVC